MNIISGIARGLSMCACPTKSGLRGANAVGEEHLQMWHVLNVHKCTVGETIHGLKGFLNGMRLRMGNGIFPCFFAFFEV